MSAFVSKLLGLGKQASVRLMAARPRRAAPGFESLEDRLTPSSGRLFLATDVGVYVAEEKVILGGMRNDSASGMGGKDLVLGGEGDVYRNGTVKIYCAPGDPSLPSHTDSDWKYVPVRRFVIFSADEAAGAGVVAADDGSGAVNGHGTHVAGTIGGPYGPGGMDILIANTGGDRLGDERYVYVFIGTPPAPDGASVNHSVNHDKLVLHIWTNDSGFGNDLILGDVEPSAATSRYQYVFSGTYTNG